jgi:hypothetical protein
MLKTNQNSLGKWLFLLSVYMSMACVLNAQTTINNDNYSSGIHNYCATSYIIAANASPYKAIYSGSADVTYTAPNYILLNPGFEVSGLSSSGKFVTSFGSCGIVVSNKSTSCTYSVTVSVQETNGSTNNSLPSQAYTLAPGTSHVYTFTPQSGYWVNLSSLQFLAQTGSCSAITFGVSSNIGLGNCFSCTDQNQITEWTNTGSGNTSFEVRDQLIVGRVITRKEVVTGITENSAIQEITCQIAPNPGNGLFNLTFTNEAKGTVKDVFVYDLTGKLVFEKREVASPSCIIDITAYPKGIYLVRIAGNGYEWRKKLISE